MRHPAGLLARQSLQQPAGLVHGQLRATELADLGALDEPAERVREQLHPVADAEHRNAQLEQRMVERGRAVGVHRGRAAGQDQSLRRAPRDLLGAHVGRQQLREDAALADPARDQLRVLATEVDDQHLVARRLPAPVLAGSARAAEASACGHALRIDECRLCRRSPSRRPGRVAAACPPSAAPGRRSARRG